jgi:hypothetical protein
MTERPLRAASSGSLTSSQRLSTAEGPVKLGSSAFAFGSDHLKSLDPSFRWDDGIEGSCMPKKLGR